MYTEPTLSDAMHHPDAHHVRGTMTVDESGRRVVVHDVVLPAIGSVGWYESETDAARLANAYRAPGATRRSILTTRAAIGQDDGWAARQLAELAP